MEIKMANNILETLTEGIVERNVLKETQALVGKWEKSGLLEGLESEQKKSTMARLLENQAQELLKEANTMAGGDVQGFAAVAFPIVRRVFAGLIANDLVSVQPMSLPSGLVFFLDFRRGEKLGLDGDIVKATKTSVFGDRIGAQLTGGVRLDGRDENGKELVEAGFYSLQSGYGRARVSGSVASAAGFVQVVPAIDLNSSTSVETYGKYVRFDPDVLAETSKLALVVRASSSTSVVHSNWDLVANQDLTSLALATGSSGEAALVLTGSATSQMVRRLTRIVEGKGELAIGDVAGVKYLELVFVATSGSTFGALVAAAGGNLSAAGGLRATGTGGLFIQFPVKDRISTVGTAQDQLGILQGGDGAGGGMVLEGSANLPELELKVDSFSITAQSRKLKASWTPELGQDLNAYHNLDAEVELTSILSEQIGLEIDQEILNDLVKGATAGTLYWSRRPGKFLNRKSGVDIMGAAATATSYAAPPDFTGNVSMWYETLVETINDVSAAIYRKTLRGGANFLVCGPEVANILEFTAGFRASVTHEAEKGSVGAVKVGELSKKWDIIVDPYFLRNVILVGRKGGSFLESGYVYAPYVPLQTTPTIFDPNTFVPRKAVMTRYGKAMVRPDMYGLVVVRDLEG
jgi:hypothetical protein